MLRASVGWALFADVRASGNCRPLFDRSRGRFARLEVAGCVLRPALAAPPVRGSGTHCIKFAQTIRERFPAVFCDPPFFHCSVAQHDFTF